MASHACLHWPHAIARRFSSQTATGQLSFAVNGPTVWNSLPPALRSPDLSQNTFKRALKTHLFSSVQRHSRFETLPLLINLPTYLLTSYGAVGKSGSTDGQSQKFVNERHTTIDISSEETTSHHLLWDLDIWAIYQHCVLAVCIPTRRNCRPIYIYV